ncbi:glycosyltransferase [Anaerotignum lactatifermentans]|uniref:Glycosyltransferase n=1 Tax=Anaerotignum lactatifermentans TaxID=160404 RepID=A0ABS2G836_9FIRM|nr:glycosyltransferase family 2 protein [Anaerotignum lactatifermentans]MBM6828349.1 glycosyltransferase [Anaerotignum lactatifermentans]MBM6877629.1 glycosyltransferase [Anaerotignum lactatifermentans]MBM6949932.1 glycosyltransferase [Anaerotignum lactatifermentans]
MASISLCMIVKNEEETMARCLRGVKGIVDEMIVVDTGSTDKTRQIAAVEGAKVFDFPWQEDFSAARNYSFSLAVSDYCMWLDADDVLDEENQRRLAEWKNRLDQEQPDVVMTPYDVAFDEEGRAIFTYFRERILRRGPLSRWQGRVHEVITPWGKVVYGDVHIRHKKEKPHDGDRNLRIYETMLAEGCDFSARELYYYGRELYYHDRNEEAAAAFREFLQRPDGWLENQLEASRQLAECYGRLGEEEQQLRVLYDSFLLDLPRAETCCMLGGIYFRQKEWRKAAFWYETALRREREQTGGFVQEDCYGYLPCIQLCVCYDRLGEYERAETCNEMAALWKPNDPAVAYNRNYFRQKKESETGNVTSESLRTSL